MVRCYATRSHRPHFCNDTGADHSFYSLQGLGGTVRISSRQALRNNLGLHVEGGTFATLRETLSGGISAKHANLEMTASRSDLFDGSYHAILHSGYNERDPAHNSLATARYNVDLGKNAELEGSVLYRKGHYNFDFHGFGSNGIPTAFDMPNTWFDSQVWLAQNTLTMQLNDKWLSSLQLGFTRNDVTSEIVGHSFGFATQLMFADWKNNFQLLEHENGDHLHVVWGSHLRSERGEQNNPGLFWTASNRTIAAGFAELQGQWRDVYLEAGLRLEHQTHYDTHPLLHFSANWSVNKTLSLRAKAANSFRPPDYGELINTIAGNPKMTSEQGFNANAGLDWTPNNHLKYALTAYYGRYNGLVNLQINPDIGRYSYVNVTHARLYGVESALHHRINASLSHGLDYTYLHTEDLDSNQAIAMRPEHTARYWAEWQNQSLPLLLRMTIQYRSGFYNGPNALYPLHNAVHISVVGSYKVSPKVDFYIRGENINNDRTLEAWALYRSGATVYGGVHMQF